MTTQSISELSSFFSVSATGNIAQGAASTARTQTDASFSQMMNDAGQRSKADVGSSQADRSQESDSYSGRSADVVNEHGRNYDTNDKVTDVSKVSNDPDRESLQDSVKEVTDEVVEDIKEKLDVTDEDIENALETLGLTMVDLLDSKSLQQVFVELSGAQDSLSLLTDGDLYQDYTQMMDLVQELTSQLADELGMSTQELSDAISQAFDENLQPQLNLQNAEIAESEFTDIIPEDIKDDDRMSQDTGEPVVIVNDERTMTKESSEDFSDVNASAETRDKSDKSQLRENPNSEQPLADFTQQTTEIEEPLAVPEQPLSYSSTNQAADISRQIVEQIKVSISDESTQMEMELNPASLGKVGLSIESKNGVITAQFSAQNEAVKAAIESQITQLQESLDKQGVKVEAVEVTVASHEFEENLQGGRDDRRQEDAEKAQAVSGRRRMRINLLDDEDSDSEEISEEEAINRDMMEKNGNTVDYTA